MSRNVIVVDGQGKIQEKLKRISPRDKLFTERLLQQLIFDEPQLLPTEEIDSDYSNLISLGREIPVTSGSIDVLYVTPKGRICVVETKLWRNPEAHRTVVAQVIDYAKDLSSMSLTSFCEAVTRLKGEEAISNFLSTIRKKYHDFDEVELQHNIQDSLSQGKFLLLIVGDKIYPNVAFLAEAIHSAPHLEFSLSMAELGFYRMGKGIQSRFLVIPRVIGRTTEKIRAIVKIQYEEKKPQVEVGPIGPEESILDRQRFLKLVDAAGYSVFEEIFKLSDSYNLPIHWGAKGFSLNVNIKGKDVQLCYGYSPESMYKQSLYSAFNDIKRKVSNSVDLVKSFRKRFGQTDIFIPAGSEMKWKIQQSVTENQITMLIKLLQDLASGIRELGLVE